MEKVNKLFIDPWLLALTQMGNRDCGDELGCQTICSKNRHPVVSFPLGEGGLYIGPTYLCMLVASSPYLESSNHTEALEAENRNVFHDNFRLLQRQLTSTEVFPIACPKKPPKNKSSPKALEHLEQTTWKMTLLSHANSNFYDLGLVMKLATISNSSHREPSKIN